MAKKKFNVESFLTAFELQNISPIIISDYIKLKVIHQYLTKTTTLEYFGCNKLSCKFLILYL